MTRNDAYNLGWEYGYEAGTAALTDTSVATADEVKDKDSFMQTVSEILANQRQYAGHPTYDFSGEKNEAMGIKPCPGCKGRQKSLNRIEIRF